MNREKSAGSTRAGWRPKPPDALSPEKQTTTATDRTWPYHESAVTLESDAGRMYDSGCEEARLTDAATMM